MNNREIFFWKLLAITPVLRMAFLARRRDPTAYAAIDLYNSINIICTLMMVALVLLPEVQKCNRKVFAGSTKWLVLYYLFCAISSLWGGRPGYIIFRATEIGVLIFFMAYILDEIGDQRKAIIFLCRFVALSTFAPWIYTVVKSGALFHHVNSYTTGGAFGAVLIIGLIKNRVIKFSEIKFSLIACLAGLVFGTSAASNVSFAIGILLLLMSTRTKPVSVGKAFLVLVPTYLVMKFSFDLVMPYLFPYKSMDSIVTLRGRIYLWEAFFNAFLEKPFIGGGFAVGERTVNIGGRGFAPSAHNVLMSVAVNTGIVGMGIFLNAFRCILGRLYKAVLSRNPYAYPVLISIIVGLINSMTYPLLGSSWKYITTSFFGIIAFSAIYLTPKPEVPGN